MKKKTISLKTNKLGEAKRILKLSGFLEKIEVIYSLEEEFPDANTHLLIETSEGEKVLELTGNKNSVFYPRTSMHGVSGMPLTFDGNNAVPAKFYCHEFLRISAQTPGAGQKIQAINVFLE